jgi:1,4-alpha-glucan branching enzyme
MAQDAKKIGTYKEFAETALPRIANSGYNTLQLMAIPEHPYYGSFGYHVSNFFAASSRFGTPEDLKELIDRAHGLGLRVIIDIVHSHSASNEVEGLSRFDGTLYQYFHDNPRGLHKTWDSRCFDYAKHKALHFLLSNCRFWLDEYHLDGFRFDGVTSMLYLHHGLEKAFTSYDDYFNGSVDENALAYLALANKVIHDVKSEAVTIAEDISGMPCLAMPLSEGGAGFDYRFAMGISDYWIKLVKDVKDENWSMGQLWYELNNRRKEEKTISYVESHDQALVGDQSLIFRLIGAEMYDNMRIDSENIIVDRGIALHKIIRLITLCTSGNGYLNFMGNEFGHPEWIDFPREGNHWSFKYARRQWRLAQDKSLRYHHLLKFDHDMIRLATTFNIIKSSDPCLILEHDMDKVIIFERNKLIFAFNFNPVSSFTDYAFEANPGEYQMIFNTDYKIYNGYGRLVENQRHFTIPYKKKNHVKNRLSIYLPSRTAIVLKPVKFF